MEEEAVVAGGLAALADGLGLLLGLGRKLNIALRLKEQFVVVNNHPSQEVILDKLLLQIVLYLLLSVLKRNFPD